MHIVGALMVADCHGHFGFWNDGPVIATAKTPGCDAFSTPVSIAKVDGRGLLAAPLAAADALARQCEATGSVTVTTADGKDLSVRCMKDTPAALRSGRSALRLDDDQIIAVLMGTRASAAAVDDGSRILR